MDDERCELCVCFQPSEAPERLGPLSADDVPDIARETAPFLPAGVKESPAAKAERESLKAVRVAGINAAREAMAVGTDPPKPHGLCRCLPTPVPKLASDWCFQFALRPE